MRSLIAELEPVLATGSPEHPPDQGTGESDEESGSSPFGFPRPLSAKPALWLRVFFRGFTITQETSLDKTTVKCYG